MAFRIALGFVVYCKEITFKSALSFLIPIRD